MFLSMQPNKIKYSPRMDRRNSFLEINDEKFEIIKKIGSGDEGVVFQGVEVKSLVKVAIKVSLTWDQLILINEEEMPLSQVLKKRHGHYSCSKEYQQEASFSKKILGRGDYYQLQGADLIVMPYIPDKILREAKFSDGADYTRFLIALLRKVKLLQNKYNIIHDDLHENNIFLKKLENDEYVVTIIDFGRAQIIGKGRRRNSSIDKLGDIAIPAIDIVRLKGILKKVQVYFEDITSKEIIYDFNVMISSLDFLDPKKIPTLNQIEKHLLSLLSEFEFTSKAKLNVESIGFFNNKSIPENQPLIHTNLPTKTWKCCTIL